MPTPIIPAGQCLDCPLAAALLPVLAAGLTTVLPVPVLIVADEDEVTLARLAAIYGIPAVHFERMRKRLERWRASHLQGWSRILEARPRQPLYRYSVGAVRPTMIVLLADISAGLLRPNDF